MKNKIYEMANIALVVIFELIIVCILGLVVFTSDKVEYSAKMVFDYPNQVLFLIGILITIIMSIIVYKNRDILEQILSKSEIGVYIVALAYFIGLTYIGYSVYFECAWDPEMLHTSANLIVNGNQREVYDLTDYFSTYPNNLMLTAIFAIILKLNYKVGLFTENQGLMSLIICECILYVMTAILVYKIVLNMLKLHLLSWMAYILFFLWGIAIWAFVPYSDATALIFPVVAFRIYQNINGNNYDLKSKISSKVLKNIWWFILGIWVAIGYNIKPQVFILMVAIIIVEIVKVFNEKQLLKSLKKTSLNILFCVFAFILGNNLCYNLSVKYCDIELIEGANFSAYHFLMMGLNEETNGIYSTDDVVFSSSITDYEQRRQADIEQTKTRFNGMIEKGILIEHLKKKALTNFADGTFAWGQEGNFIVHEYGDTFLTSLCKEVVYPDGKFYHYYKTFKHTIWLVILFSTLGIIGIFVRKTQYRDEIMVMMLALLGSGMFQMLFEARARYLYIYFPIYLIVAIVGWNEMIHFGKNVIEYVKKYIKVN